MIATWTEYLRLQSYNQERTILHFVVQLAAGWYPIFRTDRLYRLLDRLKPDDGSVEPAEPDVGEQSDSVSSSS